MLYSETLSLMAHGDDAVGHPSCSFAVACSGLLEQHYEEFRMVNKLQEVRFSALRYGGGPYLNPSSQRLPCVHCQAADARDLDDWG